MRQKKCYHHYALLCILAVITVGAAFPATLLAQSATSERCITKVGAPDPTTNPPPGPSGCSKESVSGDTSGIHSWAEKITTALRPGLWGFLNNQQDTTICNNDIGYCANTRTGESEANLYWCTFLVIDAYTLIGKQGLDPNQHLAVINMVQFFKNTDGYIFLPYNPDNPSDPQNKETLLQVKEGMAWFMAQDLTVTQNMEHTGLVQDIEIDDHGNGHLLTYESNSDTTEHTFMISDWTVIGAFYPLRGFGGI
jgi:hypothetical protein